MRRVMPPVLLLAALAEVADPTADRDRDRDRESRAVMAVRGIKGSRPGLRMGLLALALTSPGLAVAEDDWSVAESAAISEWKNSAGKDYGKSMEKAFSKDHSATISVCANETQNPDLSKFTVLLRIDATGVVESALVKPATKLAVCLEGKIKGWKTIPPPHGGFWAKLDVKLKAK